jgi:hypothetical protein
MEMKDPVIFLTLTAGSSDAFVVPNPRFNYTNENRDSGDTALQVTKKQARSEENADAALSAIRPTVGVA